MDRFEGERSLLEHMILEASPFDFHGQYFGSRFENSLEPSDDGSPSFWVLSSTDLYSSAIPYGLLIGYFLY